MLKLNREDNLLSRQRHESGESSRLYGEGIALAGHPSPERNSYSVGVHA